MSYNIGINLTEHAMKKIYLVRHGEPDFPGNEKYCLGKTDFPLSTLGHLQAVALSKVGETIFEGCSFYSSPLLRAKETSLHLTDSPEIVPELEEMYAGEWDGLSIKEIERRWPELFESRGDENFVIPGSEDTAAGLERFKNAVISCAEIAEEDLVIVSHQTVIQALLADISGTDISKSRNYKLPYCSVTELYYDGELSLESYGTVFAPRIDIRLLEKLLIAAGADSCELERRRRIYRQSMRLYPDEPHLAEALMLSGLSSYSGESPNKTVLWLGELKIYGCRKILDDLHGRFGYNFEPEQILDKISEDN